MSAEYEAGYHARVASEPYARAQVADWKSGWLDAHASTVWIGGEQADGGPAFPRIAHLSAEQMDGMTLHEYYAGQAIIGLMMRSDIGTVSYQERAEWADRQADAMIERRDKARR